MAQHSHLFYHEIPIFAILSLIFCAIGQSFFILEKNIEKPLDKMPNFSYNN